MILFSSRTIRLEIGCSVASAQSVIRDKLNHLENREVIIELCQEQNVIPLPHSRGGVSFLPSLFQPLSVSLLLLRLNPAETSSCQI